MLYDGINLINGSSINNLTVVTGATLPVAEESSIGELFYKTGTGAGLYSYDGAAWNTVGGGQSGSSDWPDITNKPTTLAGYGIETEVNTKIAAGAGIDLIRYLSQPGSLVTIAGKARWYPPQSVNVLWLEASVDTAPAGADVVLILKKNGITVSGSTVTITAGQNKSSRVTLTGVSGTTTDYFTLDVTQVGSTTPGSDLIVALAYEYQ